MTLTPQLQELLQTYMTTFYGYGNIHAPCWFIGKEEGGGTSAEEIARRLMVWDSRGKVELEDLVDYHRAIGAKQLFAQKPARQATWDGLGKILAGIKGEPIELEEIRAYRRDKLARKDGETCLMELLPLPARSTTDWLYEQATDIPFLTSRKTYKKQLGSLRAAHLKNRINEHQPQIVVFYSTQKEYREWWQSITEVTFTESEFAGLPAYTGHNTRTLFAMCSHPTARGVSNDYFQQLGQFLKQKYDKI